jgi:hypothetical protein
MTTVAATTVAWLHVATVPTDHEQRVFALLGPLGFRSLGWTGDYHGLPGTYGRDAPLEDVEATAAALADLGVAFALQHMPGWSAEGGWEDGWRVVHVPRLGTMSGVADSAGRFMVGAEQVRLAVRAAGGDFATLAAQMDDLLGTTVVDAFEALWHTVED